MTPLPISCRYLTDFAHPGDVGTALTGTLRSPRPPCTTPGRLRRQTPPHIKPSLDRSDEGLFKDRENLTQVLVTVTWAERMAPAGFHPLRRFKVLAIH